MKNFSAFCSFWLFFFCLHFLAWLESKATCLKPAHLCAVTAWRCTEMLNLDKVVKSKETKLTSYLYQKRRFMLIISNLTSMDFDQHLHTSGTEAHPQHTPFRLYLQWLRVIIYLVQYSSFAQDCNSLYWYLP